ncbi:MULTISPECIES: Yip1 family protein [unclassified Nocardiopsis]|uniref:Yip1 family protein n=1 Tax=Nocardiopsis TaxID=2013 RepID=UPI00387B74F2
MAPYNDSPGAGTRNGSPTGRGTGVGALAGGALFVGLIALCALLISYNGVFRLAEYGHPRGGLLVHVFPVTYTLLLLMACWTSYLLRDAPPRRRAWVDLVLIPLLVLFAGAVMVLNNLGLIEAIPQRVANVIVAVAPLAALLVALLLWMAARAHLRRKRRTGGPRPEPADDRTTVLHARPVVREDGPPAADDGFSLEERLMGLGLDSTGAAPPEPEEADLPVPDEPEPVRPEPVAEPEPEVSVPTLVLPRRGRGGGNPIRNAAENPPLVPIAPAPEPDPVPVPTGPVDEGFEHDPLPGDPVTDEAEAPVPEPVEEPEPAASEPERAVAEASVPDETPEPAPEPEHTAADAPAPDETPEESGETPAFGISWEPPEDDDEDTWTRSDYVPPVWTPPEEDTPEEPEEVPAPALDHDTGPAVRAAFRIPDDPMADSRSALSDDLTDDRPVWSPPADPNPEDTWPAVPRTRASAKPESAPAAHPEDNAPSTGDRTPEPETDEWPTSTTPASRAAATSDEDRWPTRPRADDPATDGSHERSATGLPATADPEDTWPAVPRTRTSAEPTPAAAERPEDDAPSTIDQASEPEADEELWPTHPRSSADEDTWPGAPRTHASAAEPVSAAAGQTPEPEPEPAPDEDVWPGTVRTPVTAEDDEPLWPAPSRPARGGGRAPAGIPAAEDPRTSESADDRAPVPESGRARRGGFGAPAVPPGAARPREDDTDDDPERTTEPLRRPALEKRPMVLKPPRPPMPDFASGPPSRRVRSEPLRPDE